ncbi:hypothetical protein SUGI_0763140 [Cryptomeria japonica]|nr:hypothetical protein SUGI_0763140 [Cryptomeria japonica]
MGPVREFPKGRESIADQAFSATWTKYPLYLFHMLQSVSTSATYHLVVNLQSEPISPSPTMGAAMYWMATRIQFILAVPFGILPNLPPTRTTPMVQEVAALPVLVYLQCCCNRSRDPQQFTQDLNSLHTNPQVVQAGVALSAVALSKI